MQGTSREGGCRAEETVGGTRKMGGPRAEDGSVNETTTDSGTGRARGCQMAWKGPLHLRSEILA